MIGQMGLGYVHRTVNHSRHFRDPVTGVCTNHVEAYWSAVKAKFKAMHGTTAHMLTSHLDEHVWRERYVRQDVGDGCEQLDVAYFAALPAAVNCHTVHRNRLFSEPPTCCEDSHITFGCNWRTQTSDPKKCKKCKNECNDTGNFHSRNANTFGDSPPSDTYSLRA